MKSNMSRAAMALSAVVALGFTAACGGGGDEERTEKPGESSSAAAPKADEVKNEPAGPLSAAELDKAVLAGGDVADYEVTKMSEADMPAVSVPAEPATCQPIADMFFFASTPMAESRTGRTLTPGSSLDATVTSVALLAHEAGDAEKVIADLRTASEKCTAYEHTDYKYSDVKGLPAPKYGDEAVSYEQTGVIDGTTLSMNFTIVRSGSTLAAFYAMNALEAEKAQVADELVEKQLEKLEGLKKS